jgi:hypothetical protein
VAEPENIRPDQPDTPDETTATKAEAETVHTEAAQTETGQTETAHTPPVGITHDETGVGETAHTETGPGANTYRDTAHTDTARTGTGSSLGYPSAFAPYPDEDGGAVRTADAPTLARRRGPDLITLLVGLATLTMAVFAFVGELPDLSFVDPRWLLAGGAAAVGLVLLVGSLRGRSRDRR